MDNIKLELSTDDMKKMYGMLLTDAAKVSQEESNRYNLLMEKFEHRKRVDSTIIIGLIAVIIAIVVGITVIFSTMTIIINNGNDEKYGEVTMYDESKINSDNTTNNIDTETYSIYDSKE